MFNPKTAAEKIGVQPKNHQWRRERENKTYKSMEEREKLRGFVLFSVSFLQNTSHILMEEREIERRCRRERGERRCRKWRKTQMREKRKRKKKKKKSKKNINLMI
jgi:hypothetical protein